MQLNSFFVPPLISRLVQISIIIKMSFVWFIVSKKIRETVNNFLSIGSKSNLRSFHQINSEIKSSFVYGSFDCGNRFLSRNPLRMRPNEKKRILFCSRVSEFCYLLNSGANMSHRSISIHCRPSKKRSDEMLRGRIAWLPTTLSAGPCNNNEQIK